MFDNLTENLRAWTNTAASRAGELTKAAAAKAEELGRIGRLKMEVYQLQRQEQRYLADLGRVAYGLLKSKNAPKALAEGKGVDALLKQLSNIAAQIKQKETDIQAASKDSGATQPGTTAKPPTKAKTVATKPSAASKKTTAGRGRKKTASKAKQTVAKKSAADA